MRLSAQSYMGKQQAIAVLEAKAASVVQSIGNLPTTTLDYRYGQFQISTLQSDLREDPGQQHNSCRCR